MSSDDGAHDDGLEAIARAVLELIAACSEAQAVYAGAALSAQDSEIKKMLERRAAQRGRFVEGLLRASADLGKPASPGEVTEPSRTSRALGDRAVLEGCDRAETKCRKAYDDALREAPLTTMPLPLRSTVQRQYAAILESQAELQSVLWSR